MRACVRGTWTITLPYHDRRYFYFDREEVGHCTCGLARDMIGKEKVTTCGVVCPIQ
jgi:hypothetical protein